MKTTFPNLLCPHSDSRHYFAGYGTVGNIDAKCDDDRDDFNVNISCQFERTQSDKLCALKTTLPLLPPNKGKRCTCTYPLYEQIGSTSVAIRVRYRRWSGGPTPPKFQSGHPLLKVSGPTDHPNISPKVVNYLAQSTLKKPILLNFLGENPQTPHFPKYLGIWHSYCYRL